MSDRPMKALNGFLVVSALVVAVTLLLAAATDGARGGVREWTPWLDISAATASAWAVAFIVWLLIHGLNRNDRVEQDVE